MATLTVATLTQGSGFIDPVNDLVAIENSGVGDYFYNPPDRRTILIVYNGSAVDHSPMFWPSRYFDGDDYGDWVGLSTGRQTLPNPSNPATGASGELGSVVEAGDTKIYGPFPSFWFNRDGDLLWFYFNDTATGSATNGSGIKVLPVYVPNVAAAAHMTLRSP